MKRRNAVADTVPDESVPAPAQPRVLAAPCRHLRSNGTYIFDNVPEDEDYETSGAWCQQTMKCFGPDDDLVGRRECRDSGRSCYEPL